MTRVTARCDVDCPFSATTEMIEHLREDSTQRTVGPFSTLRARVQIETMTIRDDTDQTRIHEAIQLRWKAPSQMPLPIMNGLITVRPNGPATELRMEGTYEPPFGVFGRLFDLLIGRFLAQRTLKRFLDELHDFIEQEWHDDPRRNA